MSLCRNCPRLVQTRFGRPLPSHVFLPISESSQLSARRVSSLNPLPVDSEEAAPNSKTHQKVWDSVVTTVATLACIGVAGYGYHKYYKWLVLKKIENAFTPGDPALDLIPRVIAKGTPGAPEAHWVTRWYLYG